MFKLIFNTYKTSFSGLSRETWLLSIVMMFNRCGSMAVPFMGLYVTQSLHRSEMDAGLIITLFGVGSILGSATGGKLTDMIGFRPVQILSSIVGGLLFILFSTITHFYSLCILTVVISFFSEAFRPANFTAVAHYAAEGTITRSYSLNRLAVNIGWSVGISLAGIIASINYKLLFIVEGGVSIIVGLLILSFLPQVKDFIKKAKENASNMVILKPWEDTFFVKFILLTTVFITCAFLMFRVVPVFFKEQWHIDEFQIGIIIGINGAVIALFEMIMINKIEAKRSPMFFIIVGAVLFAVSYIILSAPVSFHIAAAILTIVVFTCGEMLTLPFINTIVISRSNEHNRGLYAAGYTLSWSCAQVFGPYFGFLIAKNFGYNWLWIGLAAMLLLCTWGFNTLNKKQAKSVLLKSEAQLEIE
ncbi:MULTISPECIES: MFS transporter [unclassified Pedobacter]|uniref:MFS transporter n=1 Tax=unclassified Pedobacter TaxID=2628915 RepID=UPI001D27D54B|nr:MULTISPECIES: MFS transporter [unclassified Pedobacter]CAH0270283.1 Multidrug resistance protein MdtG [Pedobacter sp. Bi36]CAH0300669.1 Multidrug resistance protein MdtG [Pedobacter sp. Bi126]